MKNKKTIIAKIAKRKRISPKNITNFYADAFNYYFSYININGKLVKHDLYSFNKIGERPEY